MPELGNTNFEPVPFGGTNPGFPEPPHELQKDINEMLLVYTTPIFNPKMSRVGKATLDPAKVKIAQTQWFSGGGGFIESMTTFFEENNGCSANSLVIANVRKYCKELQKHPKLKNKSCEEIILILTQDLYDRFNKKVRTLSLLASAGQIPTGDVPESLPENSMLLVNIVQYLLPMKRAMMKSYGVETKKKRIFGIAPPTGLPQPHLPPPAAGPGWGEEEIAMLPPNILLWHQGGGWGSPGRGTHNPPVTSPYGASACCPPIGCDVIVTIGGYDDGGGQGIGSFHMVAGKITKCEPFIIACEEHPLQGAGERYDLEVVPPSPTEPAFNPSGGGIVLAYMSPTSPTSMNLVNEQLVDTGFTSREGYCEIISIICLC